jgi:hypothetical protein
MSIVGNKAGIVKIKYAYRILIRKPEEEQISVG